MRSTQGKRLTAGKPPRSQSDQPHPTNQKKIPGIPPKKRSTRAMPDLPGSGPKSAKIALKHRQRHDFDMETLHEPS